MAPAQPAPKKRLLTRANRMIINGASGAPRRSVRIASIISDESDEASEPVLAKSKRGTSGRANRMIINGASGAPRRSVRIASIISDESDEASEPALAKSERTSGRATESVVPHTSDIPAPAAQLDDEPTFILFPKLALELRLMIIKFASSHPRLLPAQALGGIFEKEKHPIKVRVPAVLQVNQEFRTEALRSYKLTFDGIFSDNNTFTKFLYYNSGADVFQFNYEALRALMREVVKCLQSGNRTADQILRDDQMQECLDRMTVVAVMEGVFQYSPSSLFHRLFLSTFAAVESFIVVHASYEKFSTSLSWDDLEIVDCNDPAQVSFQAESVELFKSEYRLEWVATNPFENAIHRRMQAQKERVGGDGPSVMAMEKRKMRKAIEKVVGGSG